MTINPEKEINEFLENNSKRFVYPFQLKGIDKLKKFHEEIIPTLIKKLKEGHDRKLIKRTLFELRDFIPSLILMEELQKEKTKTKLSPYYYDLLEIIIELNRLEDYENILKHIEDDINRHISKNKKILHFLQNYYRKLKNFDEEKKLLEIIVRTNRNRDLRREALEIYLEFLQEDEKTDFLIDIFYNESSWVTQRKIIDKFSNNYDDPPLEFYFDILIGKRHFNYGVRYNVWNNLYDYFKQLDSGRIEKSIISNLRNAILNETSVNVIIGYTDRYGDFRPGGIINKWFSLAKRYNLLYSSLVNHTVSRIFSHLIDILERDRNNYVRGDRFEFIKSLVIWLKMGNVSNKENRIARILNTFKSFLSIDNVDEVVRFLREQELKEFELYPEALILMDTEEPWLSVKYGIVGGGGSGKSSLAHYLAYEKPREEDIISTFGIITYEIDFPEELLTKQTLDLKEQSTVKLRLWDFAGQSLFWASHKFYFHKISGFLILFNERSEKSIEEVKMWISRIEKYYDQLPTLFIINTMYDHFQSPVPQWISNLFSSEYNINKIYQVCSIKHEKEGFGISDLKRDLFSKYNWKNAHPLNVSVGMIEILEYFRNNLLYGDNLFINKNNLLNILKEDDSINLSFDQLELGLRQSLIKLENEGNIILFKELIILNPQQFSALTSTLCQEAQRSQGMVKINNITKELFPDDIINNLEDDQIECLVNSIPSILIYSQSCFPYQINDEEVLLFFEDVQDIFDDSEILGNRFDYINWLAYDNDLKKGIWEKLIAKILVLPGISCENRWKNCIKILYKNQIIYLRLIFLKKRFFKFSIEILAKGFNSEILAFEVSKLINDTIQELEDYNLKTNISEYYTGIYNILVCNDCKEIIKVERWLNSLLMSRAHSICSECQTQIELLELEKCIISQSSEKYVLDLVPISNSFYNQYIYNFGEELDQFGIDLIKNEIEQIKNHLFQLSLEKLAEGLYKLISRIDQIDIRTQMMLEYQQRSDSSHFLILKALAVIIPEISNIDEVSDEEFNVFLKSKAKGLIARKYHQIKRKLHLKKFIKIEFFCPVCGEKYKFLLIMEGLPKLKKYAKIVIALLLRFSNFNFSDSLKFLGRLLETSEDLEKIQSDSTITPDLNLIKLSQNERYAFIQGLEGIDHSNHIYDYFPGHIYKDKLMMVCTKCIE